MAEYQLNHRISKQDLFACLCLWMEESPFASTRALIDIIEISEDDKTTHLKTQQDLNKVGVVVVDHTDRIVALDCSRLGLHAVVNALVVHPHKTKGCVVYTSRKPCSLCTKYMVQMGITRVYYLPFQPEIPTSTDLGQCDQLFRICPIAQSLYIPTINNSTLEESTQTRSPYTSTKGCHKVYTKSLVDRYWNEQWIEKLPTLWPGINTDNISVQILNLFEWLAKVTMVDVPSGTIFSLYGEPNGIIIGNDEILNECSPTQQEFACHMTRLAHILSKRSDDPSRGVGAVITRNNDIVAIGWNGFPSKALYGDFPRGADSDRHVKDKKYPFSIHAEQSAIQTRFIEDIQDKTTTLFVSKMPCDECVPVIARVGIKNVVFPPARPKSHSTFLQFGLLEMFKAAGHFKCYTSRNMSEDKEHSKTVARNLVSNGTI